MFLINNLIYFKIKRMKKNKKKNSLNSFFIERVKRENDYVLNDLKIKSDSGFVYSIDSCLVSKRGIFLFNFNDEKKVFYGDEGEFSWIKADPHTFVKVEVSSPSRYIEGAVLTLKKKTNLEFKPYIIFFNADIIHVDSSLTYNPEKFLFHIRDLEDIYSQEQVDSFYKELSKIND